MGCNCSSDYSDSEWIENLDEMCEHCNCPIAPQSGNTVSDGGFHSGDCCEGAASARHLSSDFTNDCDRRFILCLKVELILLRFSENSTRDSAVIFFSRQQYTNQLIPYHTSQHSPPMSPLPGNNNNNRCHHNLMWKVRKWHVDEKGHSDS